MTDMTPEEINKRISTWAGLDSHVCDEWSFHCDDCERGSIQTPDYFGSNAAMDLLGVLVERGYIPSMEYLEYMREWEVAIFRAGDNESVLTVVRHKELSGAICNAILGMIEREAAE